MNIPQRKTNIIALITHIPVRRPPWNVPKKPWLPLMKTIKMPVKAMISTDINEEIEKCTLRAESAGTVTAVNATVGSRPSETVATIQNTNTLKVAISIEEYDMQSVEVGMDAIITSDATDVEMHGTVTQISPVASTQGMGSSSSTFSAEVEITDPDENLLIGMNAKVEIIVSSIEDVYTVPYDAVGEDENGNKVIYVQNTQTQEFEPVIVTVGEENDYYIEISGDTLEDGMVVRASANEEEATDTDTQAAQEGFPGGDMNIAMPDGGNMGPGGGQMGGGMQGGGGRP